MTDVFSAIIMIANLVGFSVGFSNNFKFRKYNQNFKFSTPKLPWGSLPQMIPTPCEGEICDVLRAISFPVLIFNHCNGNRKYCKGR